MLKDINNLETVLGYYFVNKALLKQALSHSSYVHSSKPLKLQSNERLEFLGDRVLGLAMASRLYDTFANKSEGTLAAAIAYLNSCDVLYQIAKRINLQKYILVSGVKKKQPLKRIYANALEAVLAAIYLDSSFEVVQKIINNLWEPYINSSLTNDVKVSFNPKSILQEWAQQNNLPIPLYEDRGKEGTEHAPVFTIALLVKGYKEVIAKANSKRKAQKIAAYNFVTDYKIINN